MTTPKIVKLSAAHKTALSGAWSYDQACQFVQAVFAQVGDAWIWMVPAVREAMIAQEAFQTVRGQAKDTIRVEDMDKLLRAMRVAAGLTTAEGDIHADFG